MISGKLFPLSVMHETNRDDRETELPCTDNPSVVGTETSTGWFSFVVILRENLHFSDALCVKPDYSI